MSIVTQTLTPTTHDLGQFQVRRVLPSRARSMVGPFIFVDQFGPAQLDIGSGMDVRPHPHINLATVTYLFDGAIEHRDSLGTRGQQRGVRAGIVDQHAAAKAHHDASEAAANLAAAHHPDLAAMQVHAHQAVQHEVALAHPGMGTVGLAVERQQQGRGVLGHRMG